MALVSKIDLGENMGGYIILFVFPFMSQELETMKLVQLGKIIGMFCFHLR